MTNLTNLSEKEQRSLIAVKAARQRLIDFSLVVDKKYKVSWHHRLVANKLQEVYEKLKRGEKSRVILMLPPRHGKSELATKKFPAWILGHDPNLSVIVSSYSQELATDFGFDTRNLMNTQNYQAIFPTRLRWDSQAKANWVTDLGGRYLAVGIGGAIVGKGFNCFPAGTMVTTDKGELPIEACKTGTRVLSWNHGQNQLEWKRIQATLKRTVKGFTTITTTGGHTLTSTRDHPIFTVGKGYLEAQRLTNKEKVGILQTKSHYFSLYALWQTLSENVVRICQTITTRPQRFLLRDKLFAQSPRRQMAANVSGMQTSTQRNQNVSILQRLSQKTKDKIRTYFMQFLQKISETSKLLDQILFYSLQKQFSLANDDGKGQFQLQTWHGIGRISSGILSNEGKNFGERQPLLRNLWNKRKIDYSPQGFESQKQSNGKFGDSLYDTSCDSSQIQPIAISSITTDNKELEVYDIQVEDNHNFFANNVLVHNCGIIDDPFKNREEADSQTVRESRWKWYRSTFLTREEGNGAIIIILTRWHDDDLVGRILRSEGGHEWEVIKFQAIAEQDEPPYREKGEALWPGKFSLENLLAKRRDLGALEWSAQYQQDPVGIEGQEFHPEWFLKCKMEEVIRKSTRRFLSIDPASAMRDRSDSIGAVLNFIDQENKWHFMAWKLRLNATELINFMFTTYHDYKFERVGMEEGVYKQVIKPFLDEEMRKRQVFFPVVELQHKQREKALRIRGLVPRYEAQSIYHIEGYTTDLEEELLRFPKGISDDLADAAAYQLQLAETPRLQMPKATDPLPLYYPEIGI